MKVYVVYVYVYPQAHPLSRYTSLFSNAAATAVRIVLLDVLVLGDGALDPISGLAEEL